MREAAWMLALSTSTLSCWNQGFDEHMRPLKIPDNRGKASKVTVEIVRRVCVKAKKLKDEAKRIRIKQFTERLKKEDAIDLSSKTVNEILIANDLACAQSRKKRPKFYQSLCQRIPNGLLSLDGSEFRVWIDHMAFTFNVELAVDVASFNHTAFSIAETETARQVIEVLESHRQKWGTPIGMVCDSGSANLSEDVKRYMDSHGIELVPAGPGNAKGNGTDEGAFSQMKKALGVIRLDMSSLKALAKSVLNTLVSVYVYMRNRLCLQGRKTAPIEQMASAVTRQQRDTERQRLKEYKKKKESRNEDQLKLDRLNWVIDHYGLSIAPEVLKRAQYSIKSYDLEAIAETEAAFLKATSRKSDRCNLAYFFGILKNIQQRRDEETRRQYCRQRYNYQKMLDMQREEENPQDPVTIDLVVEMLEKAVTQNSRFVKELAIRKVKQWTQELIENYRYAGSLKKKLSDAFGKINHLSFKQKQEAWELIEQFLKPISAEESVTLST